MKVSLSVFVSLARRLTAVVALPFYCASLIETVQVIIDYSNEKNVVAQNPFHAFMSAAAPSP